MIFSGQAIPGGNRELATYAMSKVPPQGIAAGDYVFKTTTSFVSQAYKG